MISKKETWVISKIANSAKKNIEDLGLEWQEKIFINLENLQQNPFAGDIKKIHGKKDIYRLKIENHRLYFRVFPESLFIEILLFDYRGKIKDKTIQRLK